MMPGEEPPRYWLGLRIWYHDPLELLRALRGFADEVERGQALQSGCVTLPDGGRCEHDNGVETATEHVYNPAPFPKLQEEKPRGS